MFKKEELSIIVVDDLQFSCEVVKSGLKKAGYRDIRTANSANDAMLQLNERRADVVLADFWMPEMNGLELADLIRRWDENNNRYTGIILLTAEDTTQSIVVAFDRGVDDFVSKSANQFDLAARVYGAGRASWIQNQLRQKNRDLTRQYVRNNKHNLVDADTGLVNRNQLLRSMSAMFRHCESRGGGVGVALIRLQLADLDGSASRVISKGTLRTVSNSIQQVVRPLDQVARYDDNSFAIAVLFADPAVFNPAMFERSTDSILRHTREMTDDGHRLRIAAATGHIEHFDPLPDARRYLFELESRLEPVASATAH